MLDNNVQTSQPLQPQQSFAPEPASVPQQPQPTAPQQSPPVDPVFAEQFKQYFGVDPTEARRTFEELNSFRQQQYVQQQTSQLAGAWGVDPGEASNRLSTVQERWGSLDEASRKALLIRAGGDESIVVGYLWNQIEAEQVEPEFEEPRSLGLLSGLQPQQQQNVPGIDRNTVTSQTRTEGNKRYLFTQSQIDKMSDTEYAANVDRITTAYAQGRVKLDVQR